jgi:hypothetical protein
MPVESPDQTSTIFPAPSLQSEAFLSELECWRELVARHLIQEHPAVTEPDLNRTVLMTILRVLFVKMGEERGFLEHGTLRRLAGADHIHDRLRGIAGEGETGAPAEVFREDPNGRQTLVVDDKILRTIIGRTESFEFPAPVSAIPLPHLAVVFERYLGSKMRIAEGYRVTRDTKSAVRNAGGVQIFPQQVVGYLVSQAIGNLVNGKTPRDVSGIHILDPACGSGIFLLAAYQYLLDWHLTWYRTHLVAILASNEPITPDGVRTLASSLPVPDKNRGLREPDLPVLYAGDGDPVDPDAWRLSQTERIRILATSIFGTDIDPEAAEIARFLLLLATLDGPAPLTRDQAGISGLCMTAGRLRDSIRCGNTLIGPDFFTHRQEHPFNAGERRRVNALDWQAAYPDILLGGGFCAVIGAPPAHRPFSNKSQDEYFQMQYAVYAKTAGLFGYFIERGLSLAKRGGSLSFIVPEMFLRAQSGRPLRRLLLGYQIREIASIGDFRVLQTAGMRMCIIRIEKRNPDNAFLVSRAGPVGPLAADTFTITRRFTIDQHSLDDGGWTLEDRRTKTLLLKIRGAGAPLEEYVMGQFERGTVQITDNPFIISSAARSRFIKKDWRCKKFFRPLLRQSDIRRYLPERPEQFVIEGKSPAELKRCRAVWKYLQTVVGPAPALGRARPKAGVTAKEPVEQAPPSPPPFMLPVLSPKTPRLIFAPVQERPAFSYDPKGSNAIIRTLWAIPCHDPLLAAVLNSKLGQFFMTQTCEKTERGYHLNPQKLGKFPVCTPDFDSLADTERHDGMVALVTRMLDLQKRLRGATHDEKKAGIQREIELTDTRIDTLVYEIYGLTAEEITVVEESMDR